MVRGIIYLIHNKHTSKKFIGSTKLAMNREWISHIEKSRNMSDEPLHKAIRETGMSNFMIRELDECDEAEFEQRTQYWIEKYNPEYNIKEEEEKEEEIKEQPPKPRKIVDNSHNLIQWNDQTRGDGKHLGFKIRGKNLETGLCKDYDSARSAAIAVTGKFQNNSNILMAARTGRTAYGHKWQILEEKVTRRKVFGVNKKTLEIELRFSSMNEAVRSMAGRNKQGILKSLRNPGKYSWKGYLWFYD
jgi:group I intron endonuclease